MFPYSDFEELYFGDINYWFHRPMLEKKGWYSLEKDGKVFILLNALGVAKEDISIDVKSASENKELICISGTTKNEVFNKDFSVKMEFTVFKPMDKLTWDVENGFLTMEITFQEPVKPSVNIIRK
jgi:HSP20 family molecular chaperone IbpA